MRTRDALDAATVESLLAAAVAAPSIHNTQPWRFGLDVHHQVLEVRSAPQRTLPLTDPCTAPSTCPWAPRSSTSASPPSTSAGDRR